MKTFKNATAAASNQNTTVKFVKAPSAEYIARTGQKGEWVEILESEFELSGAEQLFCIGEASFFGSL